jgi:hypothetical protein
MRIHRPITVLAVTMAAIGAVTSVADAFDAGDIAGGDAPAHHSSAPTRTHHSFAPTRTHHVLVAGSNQVPGARFVPERVWQEINDAMLTKLLNRQ